MNIEGVGNTRVKLNNGKTVLFKDVWYVPDMNSNLISAGQLIEKRFSVSMKDTLLQLYGCNQNLIMQSKLERNMILKVNVATKDTQCQCKKC